MSASSDTRKTWDVASADPSAAQPVPTDIPALFIARRFAPFNACRRSRRPPIRSRTAM